MTSKKHIDGDPDSGFEELTSEELFSLRTETGEPSLYHFPRPDADELLIEEALATMKDFGGRVGSNTIEVPRGVRPAYNIVGLVEKLFEGARIVMTEGAQATVYHIGLVPKARKEFSRVFMATLALPPRPELIGRADYGLDLLLECRPHIPGNISLRASVLPIRGNGDSIARVDRVVYDGSRSDKEGLAEYSTVSHLERGLRAAIRRECPQIRK